MPSWNNAPRLLQIAAVQQGGSRGALLWGITPDYSLVSCFQNTPGGGWSNWSLSAPPPARKLQVTAAQQNDGCCQVWATDSHEDLWCATQTEPGGDFWSPFSNSGNSWNGAPHLDAMAAVQQGGSRGTQLWAITVKDQLISTFQFSPGGDWSAWSEPNWEKAPPAIAVAGAQQNNGNVGLWLLDQKQQLWSISQTSPGGNWTTWSGPNWNKAPKLQAIAASQQGGSRGAQLWALDEGDQIWSTFQYTPGRLVEPVDRLRLVRHRPEPAGDPARGRAAERRLRPALGARPRSQPPLDHAAIARRQLELMAALRRRPPALRFRSIRMRSS